jgi:hypothetical protein
MCIMCRIRECGNTLIMHQPSPFTDKEGVGLGDGEIVHQLRPLLNRNRLDHSIAAIYLAYPITDLQFPSRHPAAQQDEEGVLGCGLDRFAINR